MRNYFGCFGMYMRRLANDEAVRMARVRCRRRSAGMAPDETVGCLLRERGDPRRAPRRTGEPGDSRSQEKEGLFPEFGNCRREGSQDVAKTFGTWGPYRAATVVQRLHLLSVNCSGAVPANLKGEFQ